MQEIVGGLLDRLHHGRVRMTGAAHGDAGGKIQKAVAVDVPYLYSAAACHDERIVARIGGRAHARVAGQQRAGVGSGEFGTYVRWTHGKSLIRVLVDWGAG